MYAMATLQEVHSVVHELSFGSKDQQASIDTIARKLNVEQQELIGKLAQLSDLGYIKFSKGHNFVSLTENGARTLPPALRVLV
jgi:Mn-dependent DtxR family transcriptional regulator